VFQRFRGIYCPRLQGDDLDQMDAKITGKKEFVGYVGKFEGMLANQSYRRQKRG
jgi:hypothetical protein